MSKRVIFSAILLLFTGAQAFAIFPHGAVNGKVGYRDLKIEYSRIKKNLPYHSPTRISGVLDNRTSKPLNFKGTLFFNNIFHETTAIARIRKKLPPNSSTPFKTRITCKGRSFSDYEIVWEILPEKRKKVKKRKPIQKSVIRKSGKKQKKEFSAKTVTAEKQEEKPVAYVLVLKTGRKIYAEQVRTDKDTITFTRKNATVTIDKKSIRKIVHNDSPDTL